MDIEERAEKWAEQYIKDNHPVSWENDLIAAYLAGSQQAQKDYLEHFYGGQHEAHPGNAQGTRSYGTHGKVLP